MGDLRGGGEWRRTNQVLAEVHSIHAEEGAGDLACDVRRCVQKRSASIVASRDAVVKGNSRQQSDESLHQTVALLRNLTNGRVQHRPACEVRDPTSPRRRQKRG
jgi:hypothetical protein